MPPLLRDLVGLTARLGDECETRSAFFGPPNAPFTPPL
jgi:hypothetical protein